jgi:hypothetical protein
VHERTGDRTHKHTILAQTCVERDRRLMVYVKVLMSDERFKDLSENGVRHANIVARRPLVDLTIKDVNGPSFWPNWSETRPQPDPELVDFAKQHAAAKCDHHLCLCQKPLGYEVHEMHKAAAEALGCVCLPCFKKGRHDAYISLAPWNASCCSNCNRQGAIVEIKASILKM